MATTRRVDTTPSPTAHLSRGYLVAGVLFALVALQWAFRPLSSSMSVTMPAAVPTTAEPAERAERAADTFTPTYGENGSFKDWNRLAAAMTRFHDHFKWEFETIYENADGGWEKQGRTFRRFLRDAEQLSEHLDMHHRIEETYVFPLLAVKMPAFRDTAVGRGDHIEAHRGIHDGLTQYDAYLSEVADSPSSYDGVRLRAIMDGFRDVLFSHLDAEVRDIGAESLQRHGFTLDELRQFPM